MITLISLFGGVILGAIIAAIAFEVAREIKDEKDGINNAIK